MNYIRTGYSPGHSRRHSVQEVGNILEQQDLLPLLSKMTKFLEASNVKEVEGLFKMNSKDFEQTEVIKVRRMLGKDENVKLEEIDPRVVAEALRQYIESMDEPLFTFDWYDTFLLAKDIRNKEFLVTYYYYALSQLPNGNFNSIKQLFTFLNNLLHSTTDSNLTPHVVAEVFGPALLRPKEHQFYMETDFQSAVHVIENLLKNYDDVIQLLLLKLAQCLPSYQMLEGLSVLLCNLHSCNCT